MVCGLVLRGCDTWQCLDFGVQEDDVITPIYNLNYSLADI